MEGCNWLICTKYFFIGSQSVLKSASDSTLLENGSEGDGARSARSVDSSVTSDDEGMDLTSPPPERQTLPSHSNTAATVLRTNSLPIGAGAGAGASTENNKKKKQARGDRTKTHPPSYNGSEKADEMVDAVARDPSNQKKFPLQVRGASLEYWSNLFYLEKALGFQH